MRRATLGYVGCIRLEGLSQRFRRCCYRVGAVSFLTIGLSFSCLLPNPQWAPYPVPYLSHNLNSLHGGQIGDYIGEYYRAYEGGC